MLPQTTYLMRYVLDDGAVSTPQTFTTGSLPTDLVFPTFTELQNPAPGTDLTQNMILHMGLGGGQGNDVNTVATDLNGNIVWYDDPLPNGLVNYATTLLPGGKMFLFPASNPPKLLEIDLAGDPLLETNINAVNAELAAPGAALNP